MIARLVKLCVSFVVSIGDRVHTQALRLLARKPKGVFVVLYYHAIPAATGGSFGRQMDALLRIATPVRADCEGPLDRGRRYAAVTFDDGFVSVVENALPQLRSRHIPCTIFVPTGSLGAGASWLRPGHADAGEMVASPELIQALAAEELVTIGSHSITHPNFRRIDDGTARVELEQSKRELERIAKMEISSFSFPHGACGPRSVELARQAGYRRVFTIDPTLASVSGDQFVCGRVKVDPGDWAVEFRLKASGAYRWLSGASALKQRLKGSRRDQPSVFQQPRHEV
jgi:peptidoglycan/xylan/chitin deacetylase (PgdA/CDA1 family)